MFKQPLVQDDARATGQALSEELVLWMRQQSAAGVSDGALRSAMLDAGWQASAVQAALTQRNADEKALPLKTEDEPAARGRQPGPDLTAGLPSLQAAGHTVAVLAQMNRPPLLVLSGLLTAKECSELIDAARPRLARSLTVEAQTGGDEVNADRTSEGMFFQRGESTLIQRIEERIGALLRWPVECGEGLQVLRYGPGAEYKPHYDYFDPAEPGTPAVLRRGGQRLATLIMYLNTPEAGGATVFPQAGLDVAPQRGNAVYFGYEQPSPNSHSLHGGSPVTHGEKWIATKWLRERKFE